MTDSDSNISTEIGTDNHSSSAKKPLLNPNKPEPRLTLYVVLLCGVSCIGGFLFGYDTGVVSGALVKLQEDFKLSNIQQEWVVGVAVGAAALGAIIGGVLSAKLGRKPTLITSSLFFSLGSVLLFTAKSYKFLLLGRVALGVGVGLASMVVPVYIAEASPAVYRGKLVTAFGATITTGQFVASLIDGAFSKADEGWRWMLGLALVPSVIMGVGMFLLPESPRFLVQKGKIKQAEATLQSISGNQDVAEELREISEVLNAETEYSSYGIMHLLGKVVESVAVKRAIAIGCALQAFQQLGGINTVMYYSTTMIKMAGVTNDSVAIWLSCIPSGTNSLFAIVSMLIVERLPRRKLLLGTLLGTILGLGLLGGAYYGISSTTAAVNSTMLNSSDPLYSTTCSVKPTSCDQCVSVAGCGFCSHSKTEPGMCISPTRQHNCSLQYYVDDVCYSPYSWTIIAAMVFYIAMFATGIGTLAWTINSEIYPMWVRSYALALTSVTNWLFNLVIAFTFLDLTNAITKYGAFWLYAGITVIGWLVFYFRLPETRGVSLEHVQELFL